MLDLGEDGSTGGGASRPRRICIWCFAIAGLANTVPEPRNCDNPAKVDDGCGIPPHIIRSCPVSVSFFFSLFWCCTSELAKHDHQQQNLQQDL